MDILKQIRKFDTECEDEYHKAFEVVFNSWLTPSEIAKKTKLSINLIYKYRKKPSMLKDANYSTISALAKCYDDVVRELKALV